MAVGHPRETTIVYDKSKKIWGADMLLGKPTDGQWKFKLPEMSSSFNRDLTEEELEDMVYEAGQEWKRQSL